MFSPGFAQIGRLLEGETVARKSGVKVGDVIVAVNGSGFRRFASDFDDSEVTNLSKDSYIPNDNNVLHLGRGEAYDALLTKIKTIKSAGSPPLVLSLERYVLCSFVWHCSYSVDVLPVSDTFFVHRITHARYIEK